MTTLQQSVGGNFVRRHISRRLMEVLPRRLKRLLYVSSVLGIVLKETPDSDALARVNEKLHLAYGVMGMLFPIYLGSIIWKNVLNNVIVLDRGWVVVDELSTTELGEADLWKTGLFFARNSPSWIQYGSDALMAADIRDTLALLEAA